MNFPMNFPFKPWWKTQKRTLTEYQLRSEAVDVGMESDFFWGGTMKNDDLSDLSICFLMGISEYHGT
jgi:hypothetical protein